MFGVALLYLLQRARFLRGEYDRSAAGAIPDDHTE